MLRILGTRVLIEKAATRTTSKGGIILPNAEEKDVLRGTVAAKGKDVTKVNNQERVIYQAPLLQLKVDDKDHVIVEEDDILAIEPSEQ